MTPSMVKRSFFILMFLVFSGLCFSACNEKQPNVVLITIDTLRADRLGCYGDERIKTPNIDQLAKEGTIFTQCYTAAPITLPSHASIMTGTYPIYHGVHDNGSFRLADRFTTLAEIFSEQGYQTGAFVSSFPIMEKFGLNQGFDIYDFSPGLEEEKPSFLFNERRAGPTTDKTLDWLEKSKEDPFFLWVHYFDPHADYNPPEPYKTEYSRAPYQGEIAYVDENIGRLVEFLKQNGLYDETIIVLTSDHGESLGEHLEMTHMFFIYDATMQVPLILRLPNAEYGSTKVTELVRTIDIMPTLLDLLGLKDTGEEVQGLSLVSLLQGQREKKKRVAYLETEAPKYHYGWAPISAIRTDSYKYIETPKAELYDLKADPKELKNLYADEKHRAERLREELEELVSLYSHGDPSGIDNRSKMDRETLEKLQSLGYVFGVFDASSVDEALPDTKDRIGVAYMVNLAMQVLDTGDSKQALEVLGLAKNLDPANIDVHRQIMYTLAHEGQYQEAIEAVQNARETLVQHGQDSERPKFYYSLIAYMHMIGKLDDLAGYLEKVTTQENVPRGTHELSGLLYFTTRAYSEAEHAYLRELEEYGSTNARVKLAHLLMREKKYKESLDEFMVLAKELPANSWYTLKIGVAYFYLQEMEKAFSYFQKAKTLGEDVPDLVLEEIAKLEKKRAREGVNN